MTERRPSLTVESPATKLPDLSRRLTPTSVVKGTVETDKTDAALGFLETHDAVVFTKAEEKALVRKIDWVLMPLVSPWSPLWTSCLID